MFAPKRLIGEVASDTMDPRCDGMHGTVIVRFSETRRCSAKRIPSRRRAIVMTR